MRRAIPAASTHRWGTVGSSSARASAGQHPSTAPDPPERTDLAFPGSRRRRPSSRPADRPSRSGAASPPGAASACADRVHPRPSCPLPGGSDPPYEECCRDRPGSPAPGRLLQRHDVAICGGNGWAGERRSEPGLHREPERLGGRESLRRRHVIVPPAVRRVIPPLLNDSSGCRRTPCWSRSSGSSRSFGLPRGRVCRGDGVPSFRRGPATR